jgi:hypothetical protein
MASRRELTLVASDTLRSSPGGRLGCSRTDAASLKDPARATDGSGAEDDPGGDVDDRRDRASVSSTERSASSRAASRVSLLSFDEGSEANLTFVSALERGFADAAAAAAARSLAW